jgi:hypothetical protein
MFIKKSWCVRNGKKYMTFQIAESYKSGKGKDLIPLIYKLLPHLRGEVELYIKLSDFYP